MILGIRLQLTVGLAGVFLVSTFFLYWMLDVRIEERREEQITQEVEIIRETTGIYVRQVLILNEANNDIDSFEMLAGDIMQELEGAGRYGVSVYSNEGKLYAGRSANQEEKKSGDMKEAMKGNAAITLDYGGEGELTVYFSLPVIVEEKTLGIIRYEMDYTTLWQQGRQMERMVLNTTALVFAAAFLLLHFLMGGILKPIQKLTKVSRKISADLKGNRIDAELLAQLPDSGRRDEVGELSRDYSAMLSRLGEYIQRIKDDREQILKLLNSRQEFFNNVTHELKTPLTTIQGYAQLIESDGGSDRELTEKGVGHILHESTRLHQMVLQLLEMGNRSFADPPCPVDLGKIAVSVAEAMEIKANRYGCHICLKLDENLVVSGWEEKIRQVLINLIDNAIKYGEGDAPIVIRGVREERRVMMSVTNRGRGIPEEQLAHIFEPFYRVDKEYSREQGSAGLGLSICKKIMEEHGAEIRAVSDPGVYTTFLLVFERTDGEEGELR
ncbi:MAG: HAMP domain-containing protein [Clostridiales bacterium]|nr:HAMP domain-containing protein [Clostridiales bacterium]